MSFEKKDEQISDDLSFSLKSLSVGIGLGELRPKPSKSNSGATPQNRPQLAQAKVAFKPAQILMKPTSQASPSTQPTPAQPRVSTGDLANMQRYKLPPRRPINKSASWMTELFAHLVDLAVVSISACAVIMLFGLFGKRTNEGVMDAFSDSLSFWLGRFSYLEIVLLLYAGLLVYWMIFRLVAGHTIGQSLKSESLSWSAFRGMMRNRQRS